VAVCSLRAINDGHVVRLVFYSDGDNNAPENNHAGEHGDDDHPKVTACSFLGRGSHCFAVGYRGREILLHAPRWLRWRGLH